MAESDYSLHGADINRIELPQLGSASETPGLVGFEDPLSGLNQALTTASLDIRLLVVEQGKLREILASLNGALSSQQSLLKANASAPAPASEAKSKLKAEVDQRAPPEELKAAMAVQSALVDLNQKLQLAPDPLQELANDTQKIAGEKRTAPSGATAVQLLQVQQAAVDSRVLKDVQPQDRKQTLTDLARDSAVMASAYKIDIKEAGALMTGWRTSLHLDRAKSLDLGDAANRLGATLDLKASAADIGSVVLRGGEPGLAAGIAPEQAAAIAAALLSASLGKEEAGASLKNFGTALGKGDKATPEQRAAWTQLDIKPEDLSSRIRTDAPGAISDVLAALKSKPAEQQTSLIKTLFEGDEGIGKLLKSPQDLKTALAVAADKGDGNKGSMAQTAEARGNTSQGRWNALDASLTRLDTAVETAVAPFTDLAMLSADMVVSGVSSVVETLPKVTAALTLLGVAASTPLRGPILNKLASVVSTTATELFKPDAAIQPPGGDEGGAQDKKKANDGTQEKGGNPKQPGAAETKSPRPTVRNRLVTSMTRAKTFTGRLGGPLALANAGYNGVKALMAGDYKAAAGAVGSGIGGAAGGYAGAATGALIGSFIPVPVLGTAVGALVGGLVGSYFGSKGGEALGESIYTGADRLLSPDQVSKDLTNAQTNNQQNTVNANIYINAQDSPNTTELANLVVQHISNQFGMITTTNQLAVRRDTALTDGVA
ncbi:phage tail tape measure protein [Pseudomonas sp. 10S4]|uniref:phage tail tape measure protein n=1 Tax=Pseudomonas sp. 10S4 TaxID=3048583 RepID=UPI002AC8D399|nr:MULTISPECIES: phage tail tape measure protein [unclassified Pseudomonas]MEB0223626.1 phage tail tape measure protein [Pseudomonas sp. 5S1]MEB0297815.1 phage tail tape measure protein [Pseudomonas sp. 10S4]WPX21066.1 phage tail tape measure protein [Pseudomonas sp. 10S4]